MKRIMGKIVLVFTALFFMFCNGAIADIHQASVAAPSSGSAHLVALGMVLIGLSVLIRRTRQRWHQKHRNVRDLASRVFARVFSS